MQGLFMLIFTLSFIVLVIWAVHAVMRLIVKRPLFNKFRTKHYLLAFIGLFVVGVGGYALTSDDVEDGEDLAAENEETESSDSASESNSEENESNVEAEETNNEETNTTEEETTSEDETASDENESSEEGNEEESLPGMGETVDVGEVSFVIDGVTTADSVGDEYITEEAEDIYVIIEATFTNNGSEAVDIDSSYFALARDGNTYEPDTTASRYANSENGSSSDFFYSTVNPGSSQEGRVAFDVTEDTANSSSLQAEVSEGFFGTNTALIDIGSED